jgi:hypothetical protein
MGHIRLGNLPVRPGDDGYAVRGNTAFRDGTGFVNNTGSVNSTRFFGGRFYYPNSYYYPSFYGRFGYVSYPHSFGSLNYDPY